MNNQHYFAEEKNIFLLFLWWSIIIIQVFKKVPFTFFPKVLKNDTLKKQDFVFPLGPKLFQAWIDCMLKI
jgi:hypothetical protein